MLELSHCVAAMRGEFVSYVILVTIFFVVLENINIRDTHTHTHSHTYMFAFLGRWRRVLLCLSMPRIIIYIHVPEVDASTFFSSILVCTIKFDSIFSFLFSESLLTTTWLHLHFLRLHTQFILHVSFGFGDMAFVAAYLVLCLRVCLCWWLLSEDSRTKSRRVSIAGWRDKKITVGGRN